MNTTGGTAGDFPICVNAIDLRFLVRTNPLDLTRPFRILQWRRAKWNEFSHCGGFVWGEWEDVPSEKEPCAS